MEKTQKYSSQENTISKVSMFILRNIIAYFRNCDGCSVRETSKSYYDIILPNDFKEGTTVSLVIANYE